MAENRCVAGDKGYKQLCDVIVRAPIVNVDGRMTVNAITSFAPTERGAFSELRHSLHLAVTLVPCTQKSEP